MNFKHMPQLNDCGVLFAAVDLPDLRCPAWAGARLVVPFYMAGVAVVQAS